MGVNVKKGAEAGKAAGKAANAPLVINQITIRSADRSPKVIKSWRDGHMAAESVIYPNRCKLYDVYSDIILDGHLSGVISKRVDAVLNKTLYFERQAAKDEKFDALIESTPFRDMMRLMLETPMWGISGLEAIPAKELTFKKIPRKHIKPHKKIISTEQSGETGIDYTQLPNVWIMGEDDDLGLLLKCAPYAIYKKGNLADWAQFIEIFGQPVRVIKYNAEDQQTKMELQQVLDDAGSSLAIMIPEQANFQMLDGKQTNGDGKLQDTFMRSLNDEMSIIVLGNTETTANNRGGSNAKAQEQGKQQLEITKSDLKYILNLLNSKECFDILRSYGWNVDGGKFTFEKDVDMGMVAAKIDLLERVAENVPVDDQAWYDYSGVPKPANYDALIKEREEARKAITKGKKKKATEEDEEEDDDTQPSSKGKKNARTLSAKWFESKFLSAFFS